MKKLKVIIYTIVGIVTALITALLIFTAGGGFDTTEVSDYFIRRVRAPLSNARTVVLDLDYRAFMSDNTLYNQDIALISLLINSHPAVTHLMSDIGLSNIEAMFVGTNIDTDQAHLSMGHRRVAYSDTTMDIVLVNISGAAPHNGWFNYFDVGANTPEFFALTESNPSDWLDHRNHKGYDVAAGRIIAEVEHYLESLGLGADTVLWITGFGRSGAIANIVGANFERQTAVSSFTYAFAAPNVTTNPGARDYKTIFNIINLDDMVPLFPPSEWGFTRFGVDLPVSVAANEENFELFSELARARYTHFPNAYSVIHEISELIPKRESLYIFEDDAFVMVGEFSDREEAELVRERLETILELGTDRAGIGHLARTHIYEHDSHYELIHYQSNAYFAKVLAELAAGTNLERRAIADRFLSARATFDRAFVAGTRRPHSFTAYYLILNELASDEQH